jgi:opacity protein-like surface antigen
MRSRHFLLPTLAVITGAGIAQAADNFQIHGLVSQGFLLTHDNALFTPDSEDHGTFEFNEFALNVVATPIDRLRVGVQIAAQDLGDSFNDKPTIDWAYGNYSFGEVAKGVEVGVSAGRFKMGHGLYNDYRDLDMTRSTVFLPMAVYNPRWRDIMLAVNGFGANSTVNAGALGSFDLNAYVGNNNYSASEGPLHDTFTNLLGEPSSIEVEMIRGGQLTWNPPIDGLRLKYSLLDAYKFTAEGAVATIVIDPDGPGPIPLGPFDITYSFDIPHYWDNIFSIEYQFSNFTVAAEYDYTYFRSHVEVFGQGPIDNSNATHSTYLSAAYRFHPKWEAVGGWQWSETTTAGSQNTNTKWYAWNAALRYDITDHWLVKAEYQWTHGLGPVSAAEQGDGTTEEIWSYVALKTTFDF